MVSFNKYDIIGFVFLISYSLNTSGQNFNQGTAQISTWYKNKPGAISITFDDAGYSQYVSAYPVLEKHKIKATFGIVGEWVSEEPLFSAEEGYFEIKRMGWQQLIELIEHGHELAAHGYRHQQYDKRMPVPDLSDEMGRIKTLIETRTQSTVFTMNYPYSYASENIPIAAKEAGFLFGRTGLDTINASSPSNMYLLATRAILNASIPDSLTFCKWLEQASGNWLILIYHHLFEENSKEMEIMRSHYVEYSYSITPRQFEKQIVMAEEADYWIAPISTIGKYITERDNTEIRVIKSNNKIHIYTVTNLDKNVYNQPLTIEVVVPWKTVKVEGSLKDGLQQTRSNRIYVDVMPEHEITITKEKRQ